MIIKGKYFHCWNSNSSITDLIAKYLVGLVLAFISMSAISANDHWVTSDRLDRRTCPSASCGLVGQLFFREKATVFERRNGWGRISKHYSASCQSGHSKYVDSGNSACTVENGIVNGKFAEWVKLEQLSKTRPADPGAGATGIAALVSSSDDYRIHKDAFVKAAQTLLWQRKCTESDFKEAGGWYKSISHRNERIYFMFCGGLKSDNKIYLDASNGRIF